MQPTLRQQGVAFRTMGIQGYPSCASSYFRHARLRQPVSAVHLPHEVCCAWSRHRLLHSRASVMSSAYSVEAAETLVQLCSIDEWPGSKKLPSCAAAACSVVLSGRSLSRQSNSSQLGYHSEVHGALYTAEDDRVLQQLLVSLLGDLDATTADPQLSDLLLQLPPSSVKLLLASDELAITSEDMVWITVQQYIDGHLALKAAKHDRQKWDLEPAYVAALHEDMYSLVRLPHVTDFCLTSVVAVLDQVAAASGREDYELLAGHAGRLCELRTLDGFVARYKLQELVDAGAPDSWLLQPRTSTLTAEHTAVAC